MGWTCSMQKADECVQYIRKKNFGRDSWFPRRHETQDVQGMLYAASQYGHLPTLQSFAQQNSFCYFPWRPVRTQRIYPPSRLIPNVRFFLQSLPLLQRQPPVSTSGRLELFGASRRFSWKIKVWLRSADLGVAIWWKCAIWTTELATFRDVETVCPMASYGTFAHSSSRLFSPLFVFLTSCRIHWEAGSRSSSHYISIVLLHHTLQ